jgi:CBS domain-containing protein
MTTGSRAPVGDRFAGVPIAGIMEKDVQYAHPRTKTDVVASMMIEGFGAVPVVDDDLKLVGIVTEHDLLAALDRGLEWSHLAAEDIMARNPYSVRPETDLATLIHVLRASDLIRVPVVDAKEKLIGIIARRDIVRACLNRTARTEKA